MKTSTKNLIDLWLWYLKVGAIFGVILLLIVFAIYNGWAQHVCCGDTVPW